MPQSSGADRLSLLRFSSPARRRQTLRRAFFFSVPCILFAHGATAADCASVPEAERAVCELEARCSALVDEARRRECLRAAETLRQTLGEAPADTAPSAPAAPAAPELETEPVRPGVFGRITRGVTDLIRRERPESAEPPEPAEPASLPSPAPEPDPPASPEPAPAAAPVADEPIVSRVISRTTVEREVLAIPEHFFGDVTAHRVLVRDRQLIAVNDQVLFEGDVARNSKIREGDRVEVRKVSSLFGERYRIIGPSKRAVTANRIRCERIELNTDDRRKCILLPDD